MQSQILFNNAKLAVASYATLSAGSTSSKIFDRKKYE